MTTNDLLDAFAEHLEGMYDFFIDAVQLEQEIENYAYEDSEFAKIPNKMIEDYLVRYNWRIWYD